MIGFAAIGLAVQLVVGMLALRARGLSLSPGAVWRATRDIGVAHLLVGAAASPC